MSSPHDNDPEQEDERLVEAFLSDPFPAAKLSILTAAGREDWWTIRTLCTEMLANPQGLHEADAHFLREHWAAALLGHDEYDQAIVQATEALAIKASVSALVTRMRAYRRAGKMTEARVDYNLAMALAETDQQRKALREYREEKLK